VTVEDVMTSYAADIADSIKNHLLPDGAFVFTSSGGVYTENSGGVINEKSEVAAAGRNKAILVTSDSSIIESIFLINPEGTQFIEIPFILILVV
jgi:hypothetical protein